MRADQEGAAELADRGAEDCANPGVGIARICGQELPGSVLQGFRFLITYFKIQY